MSSDKPDPAASRHFEEKEAIQHVVEKQSWGKTTSSEVHGTEMPGHLSAASDAAREMAVVMVLAWIMLQRFNVRTPEVTFILLLTGLGFAVWKIGRSALLGWARLERLHRLLEQERYEIEHHRGQEREELRALYRAKGFDGDLLEEVVEVLMADGDRLLRVMLEEELGLTLETHEHPLKQALGAGIGAALGIIMATSSLHLFPALGPIPGAALTVITAASLAAGYVGNKMVPAAVWNFGTAAISCGVLYFTLNLLGL